MLNRPLWIGALCAALIVPACGSDPEAPQAGPAPEEVHALVGADLYALEAAGAAPRRPRVAIDSLAAAAPALGSGLPVSAREAGEAALSPDAGSVVTLRAPDGGAAGVVWEVVTWDLETGEVRSAVALPEDEEPWAMAFRGDGARLAVTIAYQDVVVIDVAQGRIVGRVGSEDDPLRGAVFTADGGLLIGGTEGAVETWDAESFERVGRELSGSPFGAIGIPLCVLGEAPEGASYCAKVSNRERFLSPTGRFYVQSSAATVRHGPFLLEARQAHLYAPDPLAAHCRVLIDEDAELGPDAFAADDRLFAFILDAWAGPGFAVSVIDTATCKAPEGSATADLPAMLSARFVVVNAATMMALIVGDSHTAELWKPSSLSPPRVGRFAVLETGRSELVGAAFSAAGDRVALFGYDGKLQTFETSRGAPLSVVQVAAEGEKLRRVTFLPDGRRALVAIQGTGSSAALVDVDSGRILRRFQ